MKLRSNQVKPVEIAIKYFKEKKPKPSIIVAPTAFGKSLLIAMTAKEVNDNILIVQPSIELLEQNLEKFEILGGKASVYSASMRKKEIGMVTYATIGSIKRLGSTFRELGFNKMIIDECDKYPRGDDGMLGKFVKESGIQHVLGLTATPLKPQVNYDMESKAFTKLAMLTSRSGKGSFYKNLLYIAQIKEMIELGYWSPLIYENHEVDTTELEYNSTGGDFTEESQYQVYETNDIGEKIINKISELKDRRSILVFVPLVDIAKYLADRVPGSVAVYGDMDKKYRKQVIKDFKSGKIRVIFNVNVLSVGFDHPQLDCIICGRDTASLAWWYQAIGRLTRIHELKKNGLVVDFSGNTRRFGKIEHLYFKKEKLSWKLYGEGNKLLTGIPLHEIGEHIDQNPDNKVYVGFGKHKELEVKDTPVHWRDWVLENFTWNKFNTHVRTEIIRLKKQSA